MDVKEYSMDKIIIKHNTDGDSRVAKRVPTMTEFEEANYSHRTDVKKMMGNFADAITMRAIDHDWSKVKEPYRSMFYRDLCNTIEGKMEFMDGEWARLHYDVLERHHLKRHHPADVNLIDVIEMLCDCVCAGMARSGDVYDVDIPEEVLILAVKNTVELLKESVEVDSD